MNGTLQPHCARVRKASVLVLLPDHFLPRIFPCAAKNNYLQLRMGKDVVQGFQGSRI